MKAKKYFQHTGWAKFFFSQKQRQIIFLKSIPPPPPRDNEMVAPLIFDVKRIEMQSDYNWMRYIKDIMMMMIIIIIIIIGGTAWTSLASI